METHTGTSKPYKHACERCRDSKLKCQLEKLQATGKCDRCFAADAECTFKPVLPRKRRKRTDVRVTNLEKELNSMSNMLQEVRALQPPTSCSDSSSSPYVPSNAEGALTSSQWSLCPDLISHRRAEELFQHFVDDMLPQYPIVAVSESSDTLRLSKPTLHLAIVAAGSSTRETAKFHSLHGELVRQVTAKAILGGERSLELIQSILVLESWYYPPEDLRNLNFYQWTQIAGTMAMQLGLIGREYAQSSRDIGGNPEHWRTILAVFQACSAVSISVRRQRLFLFNPGMRNILDTFDLSSVTRNDKRLVAWLRLQLIAEEIETQASSGGEIDVDGLLQRFDVWRIRLGDDILSGMYLHSYTFRYSS